MQRSSEISRVVTQNGESGRIKIVLTVAMPIPTSERPA